MTGIDALSGQNRINADLLVDHSVNLDELAPTHFSTATKVILGIFTLGIGAIALAIVEHVSKSHQAALAQDIINLKDELSRLPVNQLHMAMVGGKKVTLEQTQVDGPLWVSFEEDGQVHRIQSNYNPASLVDRLENDMVSHLEFYGRDEAVRILSRESALLPPDEALSTHSSRLRELSLLTLEGTLGYRPADLSTTSTKLLAQFAISAACGHLRTEEDVQYLLDTIGNAQRINDEEVLELLAQLDGEIVASGRESVDRVVRTDVLRAGEPKADAASDPGAATRQLLADLILNRETDIVDRYAEQPGERVRHTLLAHVDTIAHLIKDPSGLQSLPAPLRPAVEDFIDSYRSNLAANVALSLLPEATIAEQLRGVLSDPSNAVVNQRTYAQLELNIGKMTTRAASEIQETVRREFANLMADRAGDGAPAADAKPEPARGTVEWLDYKLTKSGVDLESDGYGRFMRLVLDRYFEDMPEIDQRAMLSSMLRFAPDDASPGQLLGALLKGAGPIMQKMLQGLNVAGMDPTFREALQDMKSNLAPIPENVVKAHLLHMVESSHGQIRSIDVTRSLGAASVGQALLCNMTLADGSTREVVIKILRPDAKARAQREAEIFRSAARRVNGMPVTFEGQLARIMDELDLRIEAENIRKGQIYNLKPVNGNPPAIASMSLNEFVEPTANTLVIDKAPGQTVDKYLADVSRKLDALIDPLAATGDAPAGRVRTWTHERISQEDSLERQRQLLELHHELYVSYQLLAHFAKQWVTEGIFGKGFYHGDLHAGNMMIDKERLTVIDFGNATTLGEQEQTEVTRMVAAAAARDSKLFLEGYRGLLSDRGKVVFKQKEAEIRAVVDDVLRCGTVEDTAKRIAVLLTELQKLGLELPAPIFNFSQCQMRLQGAMEEMAGLFERIRTAFFKAGGHAEVFEMLDPLALGWRISESEGFVGTLHGYQQVRDATDAPFAATTDPDEFGLTSVVEQSFAKVFKEGPNSDVWKANKEFMWPYAPHYEAYATNLGAGDREAALSLVRSCATAHNSQQASLYGTMCRHADVMFRENPPSFFDIMSLVIEQHLKSAVSRLGFRASYRYSHSDVF